MSAYDRTMDKRVVAPCKDCTERGLSCHERCPRYAAYKAELAERKAAMRPDRIFYSVNAQTKRRLSTPWLKYRKKK